MDALQEIRSRIRNRNLPLLDRPVFTKAHLQTVLDAVTVGPFRPGRHMDVPIRAIVGLGRGHPGLDGNSWRHIVGHVLHGDHGSWDERALAYFESEIGDQCFPTPNSRRRLELHCVGGAVFCETGNNRLPAGIAWLAATQGVAATFRKVWMSVEPVDQMIVDHLRRWRQDGKRLSVAWSVAQKHFFRTERGSRVETFSFCEGRMIPAWDTERGTFFHRKKPVGKDFTWIEIPDTLLDAWSNQEWLAEQMLEGMDGNAA